MSPNLTEDEIAGLIGYAREKFATEKYPFAPALRPIREALAKLDPTPAAEPLPPPKPYVPSLVLRRKTARSATPHPVASSGGVVSFRTGGTADSPYYQASPMPGQRESP